MLIATQGYASWTNEYCDLWLSQAKQLESQGLQIHPESIAEYNWNCVYEPQIEYERILQIQQNQELRRIRQSLEGR